METLFNKYAELIKTGKWQYYPYVKEFEIYGDDYCKNFIHQYVVKEGGKDIPMVEEYLSNLSNERIKHILSCFLLGIIIYDENQSIRTYIDAFLKELPSGKRKESDRERFLYIWMLISVFHDFGYAVEHKKKDFSRKELSSLLKEMPQRFNSVPSIYNKNLLRNYITYKCCRFNCYDHGVIGGIKLFKELCDLRRERVKKDTDHYWKEDLEYDFAVAAWAIACHNIFYINKTEDYHWCYTQMGLGRFVYSDKVRKISQKQHPLFFLLCLVDSIEPLKTYTDNSMLHGINLDIQSDKIIIQIDSFPCPCIKTTYINKVLNLNEWLTDTKCGDGSLTIKIDTL